MCENKIFTKKGKGSIKSKIQGNTKTGGQLHKKILTTGRPKTVRSAANVGNPKTFEQKDKTKDCRILTYKSHTACVQINRKQPRLLRK